MKKLQENLAQFVKERNWEQFHSPKNLAMAPAIPDEQNILAG
jgi:hypothetical protein